MQFIVEIHFFLRSLQNNQGKQWLSDNLSISSKPFTLKENIFLRFYFSLNQVWICALHHLNQIFAQSWTFQRAHLENQVPVWHGILAPTLVSIWIVAQDCARAVSAPCSSQQMASSLQKSFNIKIKFEAWSSFKQTVVRSHALGRRNWCQNVGEHAVGHLAVDLQMVQFGVQHSLVRGDLQLEPEARVACAAQIFDVGGDNSIQTQICLSAVGEFDNTAALVENKMLVGALQSASVDITETFEIALLLLLALPDDAGADKFY
jgi:hypothetical protein